MTALTDDWTDELDERETGEDGTPMMGEPPGDMGDDVARGDAIPAPHLLEDPLPRILRFIEDYLTDHGRAPSVREIGTALQMKSEDHVHRKLQLLNQYGFIRITPRIARGIELRLCWDGARYGAGGVLHVPYMGEIAAGKPLQKPGDQQARQAPEQHLALTRDLVGDTRHVYAMRVNGYSMIDALINHGDTVVLRHVDSAENGDLVAVWLETESGGETTLKRFFREGDRIRLQPENAAMKPIYCDPSEVTVQGKVVAVIRQV